jgi:hypothetical protein
MLKNWLLALSVLIVASTGRAPPALAQEEEVITYPGSIDDDQEEMDFTVTLTEGDGVLVTAAAQDGDLDTVVEVFNPDDERIANNDDGFPDSTDSRLAFTSNDSGIYRINVTRYDETSEGSFVLEITIGDVTLLDYPVELSGDMQTVDTENFRIHYTESGEDAVDLDFLNAIGKAFDDAYHVEIEQMGWPAPPSDDTMGGSDLYDVYVQNLINTEDDVLGYASSQNFVTDNPNTEEDEQYAATSYIAIDNDFDDLEFGDDQTDISLMRATAFHEYHHAIQFGFDGAELHHWFAEATSTWIETTGAGRDQDATGYVKTAFDYPELCFGTTAEDNSIMYGEWTFMQFLTDEFGDQAVHNLWHQIALYDGFDALEHFLNDNGTDVEQEVARYRLKNLARDYKLAPQFDATVWLENTITDVGEWTYDESGSGVQELGANYFEFDAPPGVYDVELHDENRKLLLWAIGLGPDGLDAFALGRGGGIDTQNYDRMYLMVFNPVYDNDVDDCSYSEYQIEVDPGKGTVNPVDSIWNAEYFEPLK